MNNVLSVSRLTKSHENRKKGLDVKLRKKDNISSIQGLHCFKYKLLLSLHCIALKNISLYETEMSSTKYILNQGVLASN